MVFYSKSIFDEQAAQASDAGEWLQDHHVSIQQSSGEEYHIFAVTSTPAFGATALSRIKVNADIPVGPVIIQLRGYIELSTKECEIKVYIKVPMLPPFKVGTLAGDLDSGVGIKVKIPRVSGSITLYARGKYLYIAFVLDVFGKRFEVDLKVMPLPFLGYNAAKQANGAAVDQNLAQGAQGRAIAAAA
ncbi:hypothetical protein AAF712_015454 [Marasmius tenuissimus]|uniref:Uncharacterized protein n=1 Tax=Marasmius tenuissimus TaxID=585030 RepID=A0ABR2Z9I2_9AGAR